MAINMHIATALIVHRATLECLRTANTLCGSFGNDEVRKQYKLFTALADADHLVVNDLDTIRHELYMLGFNTRAL